MQLTTISTKPITRPPSRAHFFVLLDCRTAPSLKFRALLGSRKINARNRQFCHFLCGGCMAVPCLFWSSLSSLPSSLPKKKRSTKVKKAKKWASDWGCVLLHWGIAPVAGTARTSDSLLLFPFPVPFPPFIVDRC